jgi:hypothetical protein
MAEEDEDSIKLQSDEDDDDSLLKRNDDTGIGEEQKKDDVTSDKSKTEPNQHGNFWSTTPETTSGDDEQSQVKPKQLVDDQSRNKVKLLTKMASEEWQSPITPPPLPVPTQTPSPREDKANQTAAAFSETSKNMKNAKTHELRIKVAPNETNQNILDVAENAIIKSSVLEGRLINREAMRSVVEVGALPITIDVAISQDLDRIVVVKVFEPVPEHLFAILRDSFATQIQLSMRVQDNLAGVEETHEEPIDGLSVQSKLDADYVSLLKKEMQLRSERDLTVFATPLERRARDDERRVTRLENLLTLKYNACRLPLPASEKPPALSSFPLVKNEAPAMLVLRADPSPREVDAQLKMAIRRDLHAESLARQERKKKEVLARAEACERNRNQLVSVLSNSRAALDMDLDLMARLGVTPPQVALCRIPCLYSKKPGHLVVTQHLILFDTVGFMGFRLSGNLRLEASICRSVMKGRSLGLMDSLCIRLDSQQEHVFYLATIDETNEQLDSAFELIWQVLRMNRWTPSANC